MRKDEIGGYLEIERYEGSLYHDNAIALNCGRGCLAYLIEARKIHDIWMPDFMCDSVFRVFDSHNVRMYFYHVDEDFNPVWDFTVNKGQTLYLNDYYGQLDNRVIEQAFERSHGNLIVDETQGYFILPRLEIDTLYTCRKYFGVSDGAFLYSKDHLNRELPIDISMDRMNYLLGRFEKTASEFFREAQANNELFDNEPVKRMSLLTENLLRSLDYGDIINRREANYHLLDSALSDVNGLHLRMPLGPFAYPLFVEDGPRVRRFLAEKKIYVPTLWPNVLENNNPSSIAYTYAKNILPLPVDQRYGADDMSTILEALAQAEVF